MKPPGFIYAFGKLEEAVEILVGPGDILGRLDAASKPLSIIMAEDLPEPLNQTFAEVLETLTWIPADEGQGLLETTLEEMTEEEATKLSRRVFYLYADAKEYLHTRRG